MVLGGTVGEVLFSEDGSSIDADARTVITRAAGYVRRLDGKTVKVVGYTDAVGSSASNKTLSVDRADAVAAALRTALSGDKVKVLSGGKGERQPVGSNTTASGRQLNRRVDIVVS